MWALWHLLLFWSEGTYNQRQSIGIFDNVGVCKEQPQYACLHYIPFVREHDAGKIVMTSQTKCVETIVIFIIGDYRADKQGNVL